MGHNLCKPVIGPQDQAVDELRRQQAEAARALEAATLATEQEREHREAEMKKLQEQIRRDREAMTKSSEETKALLQTLASQQIRTQQQFLQLQYQRQLSPPSAPPSAQSVSPTEDGSHHKDQQQPGEEKNPGEMTEKLILETSFRKEPEETKSIMASVIQTPNNLINCAFPHPGKQTASPPKLNADSPRDSTTKVSTDQSFCVAPHENSNQDCKYYEGKRANMLKEDIPQFTAMEDPIIWSDLLESKREDYRLTWHTVFLHLSDFFIDSEEEILDWFLPRKHLINIAIRSKMDLEQTWKDFKQELIMKFSTRGAHRQAQIEFCAYFWDPSQTSPRQFFKDIVSLIHLADPLATESEKVDRVILKLPGDIRKDCMPKTFTGLAELEQYVLELFQCAEDIRRRGQLQTKPVHTMRLSTSSHGSSYDQCSTIMCTSCGHRFPIEENCHSKECIRDQVLREFPKMKGIEFERVAAAMERCGGQRIRSDSSGIAYPLSEPCYCWNQNVRGLPNAPRVTNSPPAAAAQPLHGKCSTLS